MKAGWLLFMFVILSLMASEAQVRIKKDDINNHFGDSVILCNRIYGGGPNARIPGSPTYLYVGNDFPKQVLTIMISKKDNDQFEDRPEMMFAYKDVCISGRLIKDKGKPVIIVYKPEQIKLQ
jgi:hypothetical protein